MSADCLRCPHGRRNHGLRRYTSSTRKGVLCMCGIVGAIANRDVVPLLVDGLKRLEYRGYDSAGIAVIDGDAVRRVRRTGRVAEMEAAAAAEGFEASLGSLWRRA